MNRCEKDRVSRSEHFFIVIFLSQRTYRKIRIYVNAFFYRTFLSHLRYVTLFFFLFFVIEILYQESFNPYLFPLLLFFFFFFFICVLTIIFLVRSHCL